MLIVHHFRDLIFFLVILLGPLPVCLSLLLISESGKEKPGFAHNVLVLLTGWCIIETCIGLFLGIIHHLTLQAILVAELTVFLTGILFLVSLRRRAPSFSWRDRLRWTQPLSRLEALMVGAMTMVGIVLLWRVLTRPTTDWDSLMYHLPMMANWYQTGSLTMLKHLFPYDIYAYNWDVLCTLFLMPFREDFLVAFPNLIAWSLLGLAVYCLSVQIGVARIYAIAASSLVLTLPILITHVYTMHIDLPFAAFFTVCLYLAVLYHRTRSFLYGALFLAALGVLFGIKISGPFYGCLLVAALLSMRVMSVLIHKESIQPVLKSPHVISLGVISLLCFLLTGSFWYLRNMIELGNPLGYFKVEFAHLTIFPGRLDISEIRRTTALASVFDPTNPSHWQILGEQVKNGLHVPFLAMGLQSLLFPIAFVGSRRHVKTEHLIALIALLICTGLLYWTTPFTAKDLHQKEITSWMGSSFRFAFPFISLLGVTAAVSATVVRTRQAVAVALVLVSSLLGAFHITESRKVLLIGVVLLLGWWCGGIYKMKWRAREPGQLRLPVWVTLSLFVGLIAATTFAAQNRRDVQRHRVYRGVSEYIAAHIGQDEIIGYVHSQRSYLFYGKELNRKVVYAPSKSDSSSEWFDLLRQRRVSVVAVGPGPIPEEWESIGDMLTALKNNPSYRQAFRELGWLENPDGPFVRVFGKNPGREPLLYRLKSRPG